MTTFFHSLPIGSLFMRHTVNNDSIILRKTSSTQAIDKENPGVYINVDAEEVVKRIYYK